MFSYFIREWRWCCRLAIRLENGEHSGQVPLSLEMVPARLDCPSQLTASSPASARFYPRLGKTEAQHLHDSLGMSYFGRFSLITDMQDSQR
jgi:hypothetical protein